MMVRMGKVALVVAALGMANVVRAEAEEPSSAKRPEPVRLGTETDAERTARMAWWTQARFGMFIHFGLYSLPGRHEWVKSIERMDNAAYEKYFDLFDPDRLDVREWVRQAKRAGMKYVVLTTKHHEGFCLFDSKLTDYKITNTKYGRDLVREYVAACREEGLRVGFYYSLPDWHHPEFPIDRYHPQRPVTWGPWDGRSLRVPEAEWDRVNAGRDMAKYREYLYGQVTELLMNYGKIDLLWFDFTMKGKFTKHPEDWQSEKLIALVRKLQPQIIVNDRLGIGETTYDGWDFVTPEQNVPKGPEMRHGRRVPWETCQTFSGSWGYHRDETTWKSAKDCIALLVRTVSFGGNLIMNVGPTGRGDFDRRACDRLDAYAAWMRDHGKSIYGCTSAPSEFQAPKGCLLTYDPGLRRLYLHLVEYPAALPLKLDFADRIRYAQFLNDASEVPVENGALRLPRIIPPVEIPVVEMFLTDLSAGQDETRDIQRRIDAASARGGGRVVLSKGDHPIGSLVLKDGVNLHLAAGARLVGSRNPEDYVLDLSGRGYDERITKRWSNAMIRIVGARDVSVTGEAGSEICGRNCYDGKGEEGFRGPHVMSAYGVTNLLLRGYTVRDAGNFGLYAEGCVNVRAHQVEVHGGHDAFDFFYCRDVRVEGCRIFSGDDCVAGYGNAGLTVRDCEVNSACSYFRLGGDDVLIENCSGSAPAENPHRWSLSADEKKLEKTPTGAGRRTTLSVFTFFTGRKVKSPARNIVFRNCRFAGVERLLHYNLSGNERWQQGQGLADVTFDRVSAENLQEPLVAYGVGETPLCLHMRESSLSFRGKAEAVVRGAYVGELDFGNVTVKGVDGPLMLRWGECEPAVRKTGLKGVSDEIRPAQVPFKAMSI